MLTDLDISDHVIGQLAHVNWSIKVVKPVKLIHERRDVLYKPMIKRLNVSSL